jgi:hypothetical protein
VHYNRHPTATTATGLESEAACVDVGWCCCCADVAWWCCLLFVVVSSFCGDCDCDCAMCKVHNIRGASLENHLLADSWQHQGREGS